MGEGTKRTVIVGCGIGGPVLAMALQRAGITSTVYEARRGAEPEGGFLGVAPNGMNVLATLGLAAAVEELGFPSRGMVFVNANDKMIGSIDQTTDEARFGKAMIMIRRAELHRALCDEAERRGIEIVFGARCTAIDATDPRYVTATFEGAPAARADVLVGCDGIHSRVRNVAVDGAKPPTYTGLLNYGGYSRVPGLQLEVGWTRFLFGRRAFFGMLGAPDGQIWWFHNRSAERAEGAPAGSTAIEAMLDAHTGDAAIVSDILRNTTELGGPWPVFDMLSNPRWVNGRIALVGDSAHAVSPHAGQGASLAIEDALVVAKCLRDVDDPVVALSTYERLRRNRVEDIVKQGRRTGNMKATSGPIGEWFRDRMLPMFLKLGAKAQARNVSHRIDWDATVST
ncbi:MAG: FAD-dependent monooxygenase [Polyangiaceae bacterium]|nr:FAD-dependent monooxygenase [Polyangiaceae bacterium]